MSLPDYRKKAIWGTGGTENFGGYKNVVVAFEDKSDINSQ